MVKACTCPACGHPLPDIAVMLDLTNMQGRMFVALQQAGKRGIGGYALIDQLYRGGKPPRYATNILNVMKNKMTHPLQRHGLKITTRRGPGALWRLEAIGG